MRKLVKMNSECFWCGVIVGLVFVSCSPSVQEKKTTILVVGTTGMIGDALETITKGNATISSLMGPGVDPHLYKVTQGDLKKLQEADIIFYNGLHLEGKMTEIFEKLSVRKKVIAFTDAISTSKIRTLDRSGKIQDPHIWFDVLLWKEAIVFASAELQKVDTLHAEAYRIQTMQYANQLDSLHQWVIATLSVIPKERRVLVTAHDAFGYFGAAYGFDVRGLQGISTVADFGLNELTDLVQTISELKLKAIFIETSVSDKSIQAVVQGCKASGHEVKIGKPLYSDAMGEKGTPEGTYIGMVQSNVNAVVEVLK